MTPLSEMLVDYSMNCYNNISDSRIIKCAKEHFRDGIACIIAGANVELVKKVIEYAKNDSIMGAATIIGHPDICVNTEYAAMIHAIAAHACDFDDMSINQNGHPTAVLIPVVLAVGEEMGKSANEIIRAYIAGVETNSILGKIVSESNFESGWNPTSFIGVFGATIAASLLYQLNKEETVAAIGIAVGEASGTKVNYGTMTKDLTVGRTAEKGIFAAKLAKMGVQSNIYSLDGSNGLFEVSASGLRAERIEEIINNYISDFLEPGITIKPYPTCRGNHSGINAILDIVEKNDIDYHKIDKVVCDLAPFAYECDRYHFPVTPTEGKFSMAYCTSLILVNGKILISDMEGECITNQEIIELMRHFEIKLNPNYSEYPMGTKLTVYMDGGTKYESEILVPKGDPRVPLSDVENQEKFKICCQKMFNEKNYMTLLNMVNEIEKKENITEFLKTVNGLVKEGK